MKSKDNIQNRITDAVRAAKARLDSYNAPIGGDGLKEDPTRDEMVKVHGIDVVLSLGVFIAITAVSFFFLRFSSDPTLNIAMLYTRD